MKGIILAGGTASRLKPASFVVSKQLMPVYDKPLVYYPLSTLMSIGIRDILIISTTNDLPSYKELFKNSHIWGIEISYAEQKTPGGLAEALLIGDSFIDNKPVVLILGDNLFHGVGLGKQLMESFKEPGALITAYHVDNPIAFGVVEFNQKGVVTSLEEKPLHPKSHWAVPGIYFYDETAIERTRKITRSSRGELEITDLNKSYMHDKQLKVIALKNHVKWFDTGTPDSLLNAALYVQQNQQEDGLLIGSPEVVAWEAGWISDQTLSELALAVNKSRYGFHLKEILSGTK
ncbi:glucose-1-phosphate thymidylyltransferase [Candidatus Nanopelagicus abundans]|jgi:glucose-1-phosphate thymidylyltransferase|uniref:Glucose-1-phosphate thymidylyltransferase n=1 Tax=Candidatus Nanopelagicus abundans TaxID=1884916 RepID=A0A249L5R5_9ACTN|nr:sugar phosphate nucleotidyltransferase [Candidatus Nanopelagicus abundans]ASY24334.1 glucose-1-phosphate thymidylyltransferase [Candidatus Nanopelagicus abundans]